MVMVTVPTDDELVRQIDFLEWMISKRKDGDEYKRKLEVQLFCLKFYLNFVNRTALVTQGNLK